MGAAGDVGLSIPSSTTVTKMGTAWGSLLDKEQRKEEKIIYSLFALSLVVPLLIAQVQAGLSASQSGSGSTNQSSHSTSDMHSITFCRLRARLIGPRKRQTPRHLHQQLQSRKVSRRRCGGPHALRSVKEPSCR